MSRTNRAGGRMTDGHQRECWPGAEDEVLRYYDTDKRTLRRTGSTLVWGWYGEGATRRNNNRVRRQADKRAIRLSD